jgi:predicted O-linked N-acetylglucosamine transferase (SPINDLY family)
MADDRSSMLPAQRAQSLFEERRYLRALAVCRRQLRTNGAAFESRLIAGKALMKLKRWREAMDCLAQAAELKPGDVPCLLELGASQLACHRPEQALATFARCVELAPSSSEAHRQLGEALRVLHRTRFALLSFDRAISLAPHSADAWMSLGGALNELKQHDEAIEAVERVLQLCPPFEWAQGYAYGFARDACLWDKSEAWRASMLEGILRGEKVAVPFAVLNAQDAPDLQLQAGRILASEFSGCALRPLTRRRREGGKIRIGYFSEDFRIHPVSLLTAELFELHDRSRFDVFAFSFDYGSGGWMRKRLEKAFDRFIDVSELADEEIVGVTREHEIDIAVDLGGYTGGHRTSIFAMRAAPIQLGYLGFVGTMGAPFIDYLFADRVVVPPQERQFYAEKIAYLSCFQVNDSKRHVPQERFSRTELGLPPEGFVFCNFNGTYKIGPETFECWMRILKRVPGSVIFLLADNEQARSNLRERSATAGVAPDRLVFGDRLPIPEYLDRYGVADLFLDTHPYNAGTTASDALWAGLPVLTLAGRAYAARMGASLVSAAGLPELVTADWKAYEELAVRLALNRSRLARMREHLSRRDSRLFDTRRTVAEIESAYVFMHERLQKGGEPCDIMCEVDRACPTGDVPSPSLHTY